jgi:N-acetylglucosaminyldiphosphoundecaprenol N-acetyl-beta-D-mannosaminyltransferase
MKSIDFLSLPLLTGEMHEIADWLTSLIQRDAQPPVVVSHINANNYYLLCHSPALRRQLPDNAKLLFDGIGMKLAAYLLGLGWLPDLNGTDLFPLVMTRLVNDGVPLYLLGADDSVITHTVQHLRNQWTQASIVGYRSGYFTQAEEDKIVQTINASGAKVLLVGRGFPVQEEFSIRQRTRLNVSLIWNVGGLFDFISGCKPRAPLWIRQMRLEWLFRLVREPKRLWCRTFAVGPWFASQILAQDYKLAKSLWKRTVQHG